MKGELAVIDRVGGRDVAARLIDGQLEDLLFDPLPEDGPAPGTILRAVVRRRLPGQGACIVRLPDGSAGYWKRSGEAEEGSSALLQVTGFAEVGKAVPVSDRISIAGKLAIIMPGRTGVFASRALPEDTRTQQLKELAGSALAAAGIRAQLVLRTASATAEDLDIGDEIDQLLESCCMVLSRHAGSTPAVLREADGCRLVARREWLGSRGSAVDDVEDSFDRHGVHDLIRPYQRPRVDLPGGGFAMLEPTSAFTAVDVNTGSDASRGAGLTANLQLVACLPRQLRIRGLGGQIVTDFAPIARRFRTRVEEALSGAFSEDRISTTLVGWTGLGHFELHRRRERIPLARALPE